MSENKNDAVTIIKHIAVLREGKNGWTQELNIVSWYGKEAKYDIRWWSKDKLDSGKGITLRHDEMLVLKNAIIDLPEHFQTMA
ncbi:YdbC family protein [Siminovitchia fortis]|uniref:YdbC family protein n=1 Tax=Siminovitchia fortis TaxID=254758 RepID=UPI0011A2D895|nr:PC4/YdbC family ssDNA-binding protein [Siminovitchia fortis]